MTQGLEGSRMVASFRPENTEVEFQTAAKNKLNN